MKAQGIRLWRSRTCCHSAYLLVTIFHFDITICGHRGTEFCESACFALPSSQLNIRKLLDEAGLPPINIICEKVANQGLTRFEDRQRLPLGISVNFNSLSAKLLTQVRFELPMHGKHPPALIFL